MKLPPKKPEVVPYAGLAAWIPSIRYPGVSEFFGVDRSGGIKREVKDDTEGTEEVSEGGGI